MLNISEDGLAITKRFFFAIEVLTKQRRIRGLQTFTRAHGINFGKMSDMRNHMETRALKPEYIAYLIKDFNISPNWVLLGEGEMFNN